MAIINVSYSWKLFAYYLTIPLSILGFSGRRLSIGLWCRFTEDTLAPIEETTDVSRSLLTAKTRMVGLMDDFSL